MNGRAEKTAGAVAQKKPPARSRTLSLFTGQTDLEQGAASRDGSSENAEKRRRSRKPAVVWKGSSPGPWRCDLGKIFRDSETRYRAINARGIELGVFASLAAAANAVEQGR